MDRSDESEKNCPGQFKFLLLHSQTKFILTEFSFFIEMWIFRIF